MMNETLGKIHFWGTIIAVQLHLHPALRHGRRGDHRRIYDYTNFPELAAPWLQDLRQFATLSLIVMLLRPGRLPLQLLLEPVPRAKTAEKNPWQAEHARVDDGVAAAARQLARTLPTVLPRPYEYSAPGPQGRLLAAERAGLSRRDRAMSARPIATTRSAAGMPTGRLAVWWVIASEIVIFGGLLASYIMHRLAHDAFARAGGRTPTCGSAPSTRFVLLTSSLSAVLAHQAAERGRRQEGRAGCSGYTIGGGVDLPGREGVRVDQRDPARLHDHVEHLLVVLLHGRRPPRAARDRRRDHHDVRRAAARRRTSSSTASS